MNKPVSKLKRILLLGSGALKIGEAGEFDYSGSQAAKALREEGIKVILINPNIATIQTSREIADVVYFLPVTPFFVEKVIQKEKPDGILLGFGGQTALNCGLELHKKGVFRKYHVEVLGSPVSSIEKAEDRLKFRNYIQSLGFNVPKSITCETVKESQKAADTLSYPVIVRSGFSLGGLGSGVARNKTEFLEISQKALSLAPQILVEEYLEHWKEIEYEIVRDISGNSVVVCNMENFDPMGIHTGESIVVAPSQTLNNHEYHMLREIAIRVAKNLPIIGECNIQYALNPKNGDYRIIELNPRLSRSSALASKATGYPLAYVAAKLALGYNLSEIPNQVTGATISFFEPALDYVVVKIPRWDFLKFKDLNEKLGSEMQSVGEVMAIDRNFESAIQKAVRSLDLDYQGVISDELDKENSHHTPVELKDLTATPSRLYNICFNLFHGQSVSEINRITGVDTWFLERLITIVNSYKKMNSHIGNSLSYEILKEAKEKGFSDRQIGKIYGKTEKEIRTLRKKWEIVPRVCQIDTLAGEFPARTNYLYLSYLRKKGDDIPSRKKAVAVIGGGPYQIGSSVEFDWCAVNTVLTAKKMGYATIMINCNPETVSTDYDIPYKLYFEELSFERLLDISDIEKCPFIVSVGGQIPNTLAPRLARAGVKLLGTSPQSIDMAEDREKFSSLLDTLSIDQPPWGKLVDKKHAMEFANEIGFPVLVRPSYVLSGRAMFVAYSGDQFENYLSQSTTYINNDYPMVISKFIRGAKEVDFDGVARKGEIIVYAISEHIEHAGVHSGDASLVLPPHSLSSSLKKKIYAVSEKISKKLSIHGPFNIQYLVTETESGNADISVIEANLRASRSFPFVSKVLNTNFISLATQIMLGEKVKKIFISDPVDYVGVKVPHFSFRRLHQADPVLRVEMASTGEVATFGKDVHEAYLTSILSTGLPYPKKSVLLSLGGEEGKKRMLRGARILLRLGFKIYATSSTCTYLNGNGVRAEFVYKVHENNHPNVIDLIKNGDVSMVINISDRSDLAFKHMVKETTDGYGIRRAAIDSNIPLFTKATIATIFIESMEKYTMEKIEVKSWNEYVKTSKLKAYR